MIKNTGKVEMARQIIQKTGLDLGPAGIFVREWFKNSFELCASLVNVLDNMDGVEDAGARELVDSLPSNARVRVEVEGCWCGCGKAEYWIVLEGRFGRWESPSA